MYTRQPGKSILSGQALHRLMEDLLNRPVENLILSEGTVYNDKYYCVEPIGGSWVDMEAWCYNTFGSSGEHIWGERMAPKPAERWYLNNRKFWFRDQQDRVMFILKWQ